jgi:hypothetical protein
MHIRSRLLLISLITLTLAMAVTAAHAVRLRASATPFRITWGSLELSFEGLEPIHCAVTMEGSLHSSTIRKVSGALVGYITRSSITPGTCREEGGLTISQETLPWHVRYRGFTGTLPAITGIEVGIIRARFRFEYGELRCNLTTTAERPARFVADVEARSQITAFRASPSALIPFEGGVPCEVVEEASLAGSGRMVVLGTSAAISLTLIGAPTLSPSAVTFTRLEPDGLASRSVTVTAAEQEITVNSIRVSASQYFAITDPNRCIGSRLAARAGCAFKAIFAAPSEVERTVEDTITVETSDGTVRGAVRGST